MLIVNGTDLSSYGMLVRPWRPPGPGGEETALVDVMGRLGGYRSGGTVRSGRLRTGGHHTAVDHATAIARSDSIKSALQGELVIRSPVYSDREWVGWLQQGASTWQMLDPAWISSAGEFDLDFVLPDPTARAQAVTSVALINASIPPTANFVLGTAPSGVKITVVNGATAPITSVVVRVFDTGSTLRANLTWTGTLAVGATLVIDGVDQYVTVAGANGMSGLAAAAQFPVLGIAPLPAIGFAGGARRIRMDVVGGPAASLTADYYCRWW